MSDPAPRSRSELKHASQNSKGNLPRLLLVVLVVLVLAAGLISWRLLSHHSSPAPSVSAAPTTTTVPPTTTSTTQVPGPGFVKGAVTAVGDSVMIDYQIPLQSAIPGITVSAGVSRQWSEGIAILSQLKAQNQLGATVVVALGTNGPITAQYFDQMMSILSGASRVVFVNTHVDQPWQDPNNAVLAAGVKRYPNTTLVDWNTLAAANPSWFGSDGTHLGISGPGTQEVAAAIAAAVSGASTSQG